MDHCTQVFLFCFAPHPRQGISIKQSCLSWNSLCRPGLAWTHRGPPASASRRLGLKVCSITAQLAPRFLCRCRGSKVRSSGLSSQVLAADLSPALSGSFTTSSGEILALIKTSIWLLWSNVRLLFLIIYILMRSFYFIFSDRVSLCSSDWPRTCYVDQPGLNPPRLITAYLCFPGHEI